MTSKHSRAYAEILNIIALVNEHRRNCNPMDCSVSFYLARRTVNRLMKNLREQEKMDMILKIQDTNWN